MKLTRYELVELSNAIHSLDGRTEPIKDGDGKVHGVQLKPFDFSPDARYNLAYNLRKLKSHTIAFNKAQQEIIARNTEGEGDAKNLTDKGRDELEELQSGEVEVKLNWVDKEGLKPDTNKLAPSVLAALMLIMKPEDETASE